MLTSSNVGLFRRLRPESEELLRLDCLRLIASAGIVFLHFRDKIDGGPRWSYVVSSTVSFNLFVDLFFVISGYVIALVYMERIGDLAGYGQFLKKRVARLVPLHWATLLVFAVLGIGVARGLFHSTHPELYDFRCFVPNALLLHAIGICPQPSFNVPSWSIGAEFCMYVLTPAIFWLTRRRAWLVAAAIVATWILLSVTSFHGTPWFRWTAQGGVLRALPSFTLGILLFWSRHSLDRIPFASQGTWTLLALFIAGGFLGFPDLVLLLMVYGVVVLAISADVQSKGSSIERFLASGGQLTYSSYMLHDLVLVVFVSFGAEHLLHLQGLLKNSVVVGASLVVWPLSYISLMAFERPMRHLIGGRRASNPLP